MNRQLSPLVDAARKLWGFQRGPQTPLVGVIDKRAPTMSSQVRVANLIRPPRRSELATGFEPDYFCPLVAQGQKFSCFEDFGEFPK